MTTLTVGPGQQFATIHEAVDAAAAGDTIDVQRPGNLHQRLHLPSARSLTLQAVGGEVQMVETQTARNGKAMIVEGVPGRLRRDQRLRHQRRQRCPTATARRSATRAATLSLSNDYFHNNQEGLLGAPDPNGSSRIDHSEFAFNGDGSGFTHNLYVGAIDSLHDHQQLYPRRRGRPRDQEPRANNTSPTTASSTTTAAPAIRSICRTAATRRSRTT